MTDSPYPCIYFNKARKYKSLPFYIPDKEPIMGSWPEAWKGNPFTSFGLGHCKGVLPSRWLWPPPHITSGPSNYKSGTMGTNIRGTRIKLVCLRCEWCFCRLGPWNFKFLKSLASRPLLLHFSVVKSESIAVTSGSFHGPPTRSNTFHLSKHYNTALCGSSLGIIRDTAA